MLIKLASLRNFFIVHISRNSAFLHPIVKTYIIFQSSRTVFLLYTSEMSVFTNSLCIFAISNIIVLNFSTSKVHKNFYNNILLKCKKILKNFALHPFSLYLLFGSSIHFSFLSFILWFLNIICTWNFFVL